MKKISAFLILGIVGILVMAVPALAADAGKADTGSAALGGSPGNSGDAMQQCRDRAERMRIAPQYRDAYVSECVESVTGQDRTKLKSPAGESPLGGSLEPAGPSRSVGPAPGAGEQPGDRGVTKAPAAEPAGQAGAGAVGGTAGGTAGQAAQPSQPGYGNQNVMTGTGGYQMGPEGIFNETKAGDKSADSPQAGPAAVGGSQGPSQEQSPADKLGKDPTGGIGTPRQSGNSPREGGRATVPDAKSGK